MKLLAALLSVLSLSSCASAYRPAAVVPATVFSNPYLADLSSPNLILTYDAIPDGPVKVARRNQIIYEYMYLTNQAYGTYEAAFFSGQAYVGFASDAVSIGLETTAAITGTAALKSILAASGAAVTGIRASYQKNVYDSATREAIVTVMRANRATITAEIMAGMNTCSATTTCPNTGLTYTLESGLTDVAALYDAGTVIGALISVNASSSQQASAAREAMRKLKGLPPIER